jgi:cytosine/uracil/thiamine/allantoin permease
VPALKWLYDFAWFVGFFAAGAAHAALSSGATGTQRAELAES